MDYSCRDIPMKLDINHQPLNFDIYLSQVIDVPRTSLEEQPYNFQLEVEALETVERIIARTRNEVDKVIPQEEQSDPEPSISASETNNYQQDSVPANSRTIPPPSCPTETPLTPIKTTFTTNLSNTEVEPADSAVVNRINPKDFEDIHYNPFDHLELQTIDELRELDLVFQASYANQTTNNQLQPTTNDSAATQISSNTIPKSKLT